MIDYGRVQSTVCPKPKAIDEYSVWINSDIIETQVDMLGEPHTVYEYNQIRYDKDEYISMIDDKNIQLESQLTDTQLALVEVYEMML